MIISIMAPPIFNKDNILHHIQDTGKELVIRSLKGQYKDELELFTLLNFISTLERLELL